MKTLYIYYVMKIKLKDISTIKLGYSIRERIEASFASDAIGIIFPKDIFDNDRIDFENVTSVKIPNASKFILDDNEILLQSRGKFIAVVYKQPLNKKFIASSLLLRIIVNSPDFLPEYIALYLNSQIGQAELNRLSSTLTIKSIVKSELDKLEIPILPLDLQKKLVEYSKIFNNWIKLNEKQLSLQIKIFNNIIDKIIGDNNG